MIKRMINYIRSNLLRIGLFAGKALPFLGLILFLYFLLGTIKNFKFGPLTYNGQAPIELGALTDLAIDKRIEFSFDFKSDKVNNYQDLFQTAGYNSGIRMEIGPDQATWLLIRTTKNDKDSFSSFKILDKLDPGRWYNLQIKVFPARVRAKLDGRQIIDAHIVNASWKNNYIRAGVGYENSRKFSGAIKDFRLVYSGIFFITSPVMVPVIIFLSWFIVYRKIDFKKYFDTAKNWAKGIIKPTFQEENGNMREDIIQILSFIISIAAFVFLCEYFWKIRESVWPGISGIGTKIPFVRFCYLSGLIFLPAVVFLSLIILNYFNQNNELLKKYSLTNILTIFLAVFSVLALYFVFSGKAEGYNPRDFFSRIGISRLISSFCVLMIFFLFGKKAGNKKSFWFFAWGILIVLIGALPQVINIPDIRGRNFITYHFGLMVGIISQVLGGKTILVSQSSVYGTIYPYAASIFSILFGRSLVALSSFFVMLIAISWFFIYLSFGERMGKNSFWALISLAIVTGIVHSSFESNLLMGNVLPYFEYTPIRQLFPAFFSWFILAYLRQQDEQRYNIGVILAGFSVLWNIDTGLPLIAAWCMLLIYQEISKHNGVRKTLIASLRHVSIALGSIIFWMAIYSFFAYIRSGSFPQWNLLYEAQRITYLHGIFYSMSMYPAGPWNIIVFVYICAFIVSLWALIRGRSGRKEKYYFFLAVLGSLLFSYFQGRAHFNNIFPVSLPAVLLLINWFYDFCQNNYFSANIFPKIKKSWNFKRNVLAAMLICSILSFGLANFLRGADGIADKSINCAAKIFDKTQYIDFKDGSEFISKEASGKPVLILSGYGDYLYFFSRTYSLTNFSSISEITANEHIGVLNNFIESRKSEKIFVDTSFQNDSFYKAFSEALEQNYTLIKHSPQNTILLYQRKTI